ncbi:TonB-dependent receptor [uncultured Maribacter sp.]|uniref:SusC/RagA family TonB-linked outer membrane protein n=1 Tax=uncultured Maribacter sp. TaxID=431308 RepID=UPI00260D8CA7|nr:TonB-dependent receptor [uncultured Maribacter sp.]
MKNTIGFFSHFFKAKTSLRTSVLIFCSLMLSDFSYAVSNGDEAENMLSIKLQQQINGTILDENGSPLPGASVVIKGTSTGTQTDFDGNFIIDAASSDILVVSYIGYITQEVTVNNQTSVNIEMNVDSNVLDEVVVVGYGTQNKYMVTGAISTVSSDDLVKLPTTNAVEALQGKASGLTIINGGSPGSEPTVRIRGIGTLGNNNPVYVVDDIVVTDISSLSANDIASVSVLKDASTTAVYGSLGANGVIVIKTKTGKSGEVAFNFNTYLSTQFKPKSLDVLSTSQYLSYASDMILNSDPNAIVPDKFTDGSLAGSNYNYQDEIFKTGSIQNYEFSASGGNDVAKFRLSAGYQSQEGILLNTDLDRYTLRLNSSFNKGIFTFGESLGITYAEQNPLILAFSVSPIENAINMAPYLPFTNSEYIGGYSELTADDINTTRNPLRTLNREEQLNKNISVLGNVYAKAKLAPGLEYKINGGMNFYDNSFKKTELPYGISGGLFNQFITRFSYFDVRVKTVTLQNSLQYKTTFNDKHNLEVLGLSERQKRKTTSLSGVGTTDLGIQDIGAALSGGAATIEYNKIGYLGRLNYNYDNKYILAASIRRDGSSRFGANKRWGNFPSVAGGWVVSNENFISDSSVLNYLKIRGSWGLAGNDNSAGDYSYESSLLANFFYGDDAALAISSLQNPDLQWEQTETTNIGVDFGFFKNKVTFSAEYYNNTSDDLIVALPAAASVGVPNSTPTNIGGMTTKGFEFNLGISEAERKFKWSANINLSTTENEITNLAPNVEQIFNGDKPNVLANGSISRIAVGESLWHFYGYETDGIFQNDAEVASAATQNGAAPGDIRFKDNNGDGEINSDDRVVIGNPFPDVSYGVSLDGSYENFDMAVLFTGVAGNEIFNATRYYLDGASQLTNASTAVLDRWTTTNPSNTQPRAVLNDPNQNSRVSDRYVEDGSYLRLRNVSVGYSLPRATLERMIDGTFSKLRIYMSAQNLITITDYSGFDPEVGPSLNIGSTSGDGNSELGIDRGQYPQSKSFVVGLQMSF